MKILFTLLFFQISISQIIDTINPSNYPTKIKWKTNKVDNIEELKMPIVVKKDSVKQSTLRGFRIQLAATSEFDELETYKSQIATFYSNNEIFMVFDAPMYKIRVGNYISKKEAEKQLLFLKQNGFQNAWIVPENIIAK